MQYQYNIIYSLSSAQLWNNSLKIYVHACSTYTYSLNSSIDICASIASALKKGELARLSHLTLSGQLRTHTFHTNNKNYALHNRSSIVPTTLYSIPSAILQTLHALA